MAETLSTIYQRVGESLEELRALLIGAESVLTHDSTNVITPQRLIKLAVRAMEEAESDLEALRPCMHQADTLTEHRPVSQ